MKRIAYNTQLLTDIRKSQGLTQQELADKAGINVITIRRMEGSEKKTPSEKTLSRLCNALNIDMDLIRRVEYLFDMQRVIDAREEKGLSQEGLSQASGVPLKIIKELESKKEIVRSVDNDEIMEKICSTLLIPYTPAKAIINQERSTDSPLDIYVKSAGALSDYILPAIPRYQTETSRITSAIAIMQRLNEAGQRSALDLLELVRKVPEYKKES